MLRNSLLTALVLASTACGMGTEGDPAITSGTAQDALYRDQLQPAAFDPLILQRVERCTDEIIRPTVVATLHEMVQLRTREVLTDVGAVVQSSYVNTNGADEEIRKGIAEFEVQGDVRRALLRFKEARAVWPYRVPADTHGISVYSADFKATVGDFADPAVEVARFETSVNALPAELVTTDVTRAVQVNQPAVGFRFALENIPGSGTEFDNVELVIQRCHNTVREL